MATYPHVNAANRYARDVVAGKILACRYVKLACKRHLDDLERAKDQRWPYRFDREAAERFCRFSEKMPHTSGEWARKKLRLTLEDWQKFCFCVGFGWKRKTDGLRRFQEIYIEVPRKNGKSLIAASVGNYMFCADGEHGAEVYCGATTEKQAFKVFEPARQMVAKLPALRRRFSIKTWAKKLTRPDGSVFAPIIGDPGDGDSPSCAIIDEYHEHATDALYTTMTTGMGAREQPMTLIITTAGYDIASPCYEKRSQVVEILEGIRSGGANETIFGIIYTLDHGDDWTTEEAIRKANPNFGVSIKPEFLRAKQELAKSTPSQTNKILTKHFNLWVSSKAAYYNLQKWHEAADPSLTLADFEGEPCYLGIDLASKLDLNAVVPVFMREIDGVRHFYCVGAMFWVPEDSGGSSEGCTQEYRPYNSNVCYRRYYRGDSNAWSAWEYDVTSAGGVINGFVEISGDGPSVTVKPKTANAIYSYFGRKSNNTDHFYIGQGAAHSDNVTWGNFLTNSSITLVTGGAAVSGQIMPSDVRNFDARYQLRNMASGGANGWFKDVSTGLIFQWGFAQRAADTTRIAFPVAFPGACFGIVHSLMWSGGFHDQNAYVQVLDRTAFNYLAQSGEPTSFYIAVGA
ncbi:terminase large subunit domain-containing protein [Cronobacter dublinensis]|uniref:terminase large subunit domain-containing protein n=1 Tax=Cronobacter dublinensis TaxID=413497 RepID=UPI0024AF4A84|nr:terminase large subunit [Cronobacter dublinensis]MDI7390304.1 terminase large subunit [Cronobacter dublinensis]